MQESINFALVMKIRKCPNCGQLTHLETGQRVPLFCWHCAARVDFVALRTPEEWFALRTIATFERALPDPSRLVRAGKIALLVATPVAVVMLLICNGFDIFVVCDAAAPFVMR